MTTTLTVFVIAYLLIGIGYTLMLIMPFPAGASMLSVAIVSIPKVLFWPFYLGRILITAALRR